MKKEFVPYDIALAMHELGFDEECFKMYMKNAVKLKDYRLWQYCHLGLKAPLYQQAFRWFREKHELYGSVGYNDDLKSEWGGSVKGYYGTWGKYDLGFTRWFKTYQEAQDACLRKLIEIVKEK